MAVSRERGGRLGCTLEIGLLGLADGLELRTEGKGGIKDDLQVFGLMVGGEALCQCGEDVGKNRYGSENQDFCLRHACGKVK